MATEIVKTIRASGGDYTTLSAWEAALPASMVANDEQHTAVCYNDWPSGLADPVVISGSTTDATRFIKVTVAEGHRHDGTGNHTGFYLKGDKGSNDRYFKSSVAYTQLEWLDVEHTRVSNGAGAIEHHQLYGSAKNCIGKCANTSLTTYAIAVSGITNTESEWPLVINCLAINAQVGFRNQADASRRRAKQYNCTAVNCGTGFLGAPTVPGTAINCVAHDCTTGFTTGWLAESDYNASSDSTAASFFTNNVTGVVDADFVDATGGDYHLASGSALIGAGANLYATFDLDIDGDIRPSSGAWDIGFDHYVAGGDNIITAGFAGINLTLCNITSSKVGSGVVAAYSPIYGVAVGSKIGPGIVNASAAGYAPMFAASGGAKISAATLAAVTQSLGSWAATKIAAGSSANYMPMLGIATGSKVAPGVVNASGSGYAPQFVASGSYKFSSAGASAYAPATAAASGRKYGAGSLAGWCGPGLSVAIGAPYVPGADVSIASMAFSLAQRRAAFALAQRRMSFTLNN